jgi:hypothetical protein
MDIFEIDTFWHWFGERSETIRNLMVLGDSIAIAKILDSRVAELAVGCSWEVGPVDHSSVFFAISPNGDVDKLSVTKDIIRRAPIIPGWNFYPAKPPKKWDLRFVVSLENGRPISIDANGFRYSLIAFAKNRFFDVKLHAPRLPEMDLEARNRVGRIVVEGILGEEFTLQNVDRVELIENSVITMNHKSGSISKLKEHIESLVRSRTP